MSNLEPIEEGDLDLKGKFLGGPEHLEEKTKKENIEPAMKEIKDPEFSNEKKEKVEERSIEKEKTYSKILSKIRTVKPSADDSTDMVENDAKETVETATAEAKVDKLVKLAILKGVVHAVKVAKHMEDSYVLDEFHDKMMAEELHEALVKKGIIKEL
jgi:hypothetical protein